MSRISVNWKSFFMEFLAPHGFVYGFLFFNIYLNDLICLTESTDMCYVADDIIFFACEKDLNSLIKRLEHASLLATEWFQINMDKHYIHTHENYCRLVYQSAVISNNKIE